MKINDCEKKSFFCSFKKVHLLHVRGLMHACKARGSSKSNYRQVVIKKPNTEQGCLSFLSVRSCFSIAGKLAAFFKKRTTLQKISKLEKDIRYYVVY